MGIKKALPMAVMAAVALVVLATPGCVDQKGSITQETKQDIKELIKDALGSLPTPTINVPPNQSVDTSGLRENIRQDIKASADNSAAQMTGAVNTSVNKIANDITGVRAELGKLLEINNNLYMQLNSNITNNMTANASVVAELKSNIQAVAKITAELEIKASVVADLNATVNTSLKVMNEMKAQADLNASAIAGIANKVENINATAGRDVNMLPRSAVVVVGIVVLAMSLLAACAVSWAFKTTRDSAAEEAKTEREEARRLYGLLMKALVHVPEHQATGIARELTGGGNAANQTVIP